jgi:hypothetical protein
VLYCKWYTRCTVYLWIWFRKASVMTYDWLNVIGDGKWRVMSIRSLENHSFLIVINWIWCNYSALCVIYYRQWTAPRFVLVTSLRQETRNGNPESIFITFALCTPVSSSSIICSIIARCTRMCIWRAVASKVSTLRQHIQSGSVPSHPVRPGDKATRGDAYHCRGLITIVTCPGFRD